MKEKEEKYLDDLLNSTLDEDTDRDTLKEIEDLLAEDDKSVEDIVGDLDAAVSFDLESMMNLEYDEPDLSLDPDLKEVHENDHDLEEKVSPKEKGKNKKEKKKSKSGFIEKIKNIFFEEEKKEKGKNSVPEEKLLKNLTPENKDVLQIVDKEEKKRKKKKIKEEKAANKEALKKKKREEKIKKKQAEEAALPPEKKLSIKGIVIIVIMVTSLCILAVLCIKEAGYKNMMHSAEDCYTRDEYIDAYAALEGRTLDKKDQGFFNKTELMAGLDLYYQSAKEFQKRDMKQEELDKILKGLKYYENNKNLAEEMEIEEKFHNMGGKLEEMLNNNFSLDYADAERLNNIENIKNYWEEIKKIIKE